MEKRTFTFSGTNTPIEYLFDNSTPDKPKAIIEAGEYAGEYDFWDTTRLIREANDGRGDILVVKKAICIFEQRKKKLLAVKRRIKYIDSIIIGKINHLVFSKFSFSYCTISISFYKCIFERFFKLKHYYLKVELAPFIYSYYSFSNCTIYKLKIEKTEILDNLDFRECEYLKELTIKDSLIKDTLSFVSSKFDILKIERNKIMGYMSNFYIGIYECKISNFRFSETSFKSMRVENCRIADFVFANVSLFSELELIGNDIRFFDGWLGSLNYKSELANDKLDLTGNTFHDLIVIVISSFKKVSLGGSRFKNHVEFIAVPETTYASLDAAKQVKSFFFKIKTYHENFNHKTKKEKNLALKNEYLSLCDIYKNNNDFENEDLAWVEYMRTKGKLSKWFEKPVYWFLDFTSNYASKPGRVLISILFTWGFTALIFWLMAIFGVNTFAKPTTCFLDCLYFSGITFLTIGYGDIQPQHIVTKLLATVEGFLGVFFIAMLTVSVFRKYTRK